MNGNFQEQYWSLFARLGYPLKARDGLSETLLTKAEAKLGIRLPQALRDYYLVAGRERTLNHSFDQLRAPSEWETHDGKLVFLEENQSVVVWGVTATPRAGHDPKVFQAPRAGGDLDRWYPEHDHCSEFLRFMVHLQAAYGGGMPCTASASVPPKALILLKQTWSFGGEVNKMRAYSREQQVVCVTPWQGLGEKRKSLRAFAGALTKEGLESIAVDLKLKWDSKPPSTYPDI